MHLRSPMTALKIVIEEYIEKWCHFIVDLGVGGLWIFQNECTEFLRHRTGDDLAVYPIAFLQK